MIISFKHNFIYWRPLKVGGSSVLQALGEYCGDNDIVNRPEPIQDILKLGLKIYKKNFEGYRRHMLPSTIKEVAKIDWNSFFKFTIVRNPWDMAVSMYWWDRILGQTFSEWLAKPTCLVGSDPGEEFFHENYYFKNENKIADYYLRYENLESDYKRICEWVGIPYKKLPVIKGDIRIDKKHYSKYYNKADIEFVAKMFPQTIKEFGYDFESNMANRITV